MCSLNRLKEDTFFNQARQLLLTEYGWTGYKVYKSIKQISFNAMQYKMTVQN